MLCGGGPSRLQTLTCVLLLVSGQLVDSGADVLPQALDDAAQRRHAALIQVREELVLIFVYPGGSGFDVSQVDVILLQRQRQVGGAGLHYCYRTRRRARV